MRLSPVLLVGMVLATVLWGTGPSLAQSLPAGGDLTCQGPYSSNDTGESLLTRYQSQARIMEVADLSGESGDSLVLYPDDPNARIETGDAHGNGTGRITALTVKGRNSLWTVGGLKIGTRLNELTEINGGPVTLTGFWQETGTTFSMLGWLPRGDCKVTIVMFAPQGMRTDHPLYGLKKIQSDDPRLASFDLEIDELILIWPEVSSD
ncbi:MAG: hypothetical protein JWR51_3519 [Devosia sp.]|uniref:hypothetical protein n=1 Tax=Devosia sp. TaxID=1871048 RepID=UPI00262E05B8|nr:hypothetical protein [Devosia sp.]MDB5530416.1 hypothetical protein [Devosia sp.]